jgi:two-component system sensor histidine kinase QseC
LRSLRGRLTFWLLAGTGLLLVIGGLILDGVIGSRLRREADISLIEEAKALQTATVQQDGRVWLELVPGADPEFEPGKKPDYFEIWRADGSVLARSRSLIGRDLPRWGSGTGRPRLFDFTLPDGRPGRRVEIRFLPQIEEEAGDAADAGETIRPALPGTPTVTLAVAQGREDLDAFLASLHLTLTLFVLALLAGMAILVKLAVGRGLAPLDGLARRLETLDAGSLGEPLVIADAPAELASTIERLNALLARLRESFERERTFSANLAHELRTPLAELRAVTDVALKWPEELAADTLEEIHGIGLQMERVVVNLLALARCDGRQDAVELSEVPLRELAVGCWNAVAAEAAAEEMRLALEIPGGLTLVTDREKLGLILANLFANAVAHGAPGSTVTCGAAVAGDEIAIEVSNPAPELAAADLPRLFDRFWRRDAARSGGRHAGLGLSLVAALCEALGLRREARLHEGLFAIILTGRLDAGLKEPA